jgi:hypothetical protein
LDLNSSDAPHQCNSDSSSATIPLHETFTDAFTDAFDDAVADTSDAAFAGAVIRLSEQGIQPPVTAPQIIVLKPAPPKTGPTTQAKRGRRTKPDRHGAASASVRSINSALREPSKAGVKSSDGGQPAIAPPGHLQTVQDMTNQGLALKHQTDALIANIRVRQARAKSATPAQVRMTLADILPINGTAPLLDLPPTTRAISSTGRIRVTVRNRTLAELLGWTPGPLSVCLDGTWMILRPDTSGRPPRRNDGHCSYTQDDRLRVTQAVRTYLGLAFGDEVALLVLPAHGVLALANPSRLLLGAPLAILDQLKHSTHGGI